ncbi:MAG TPA: ABC transporter permease [Caldilineae bacterium]|nr:ABC transporter permease [Caldilineae bacterium]
MNLHRFQDILRYPSAIVGLLIILFLVVLSIYVVIAIPYREAITKWRGGDFVWQDNPRMAPPTWVNYFRSKKLPETIIRESANGAVAKERTPLKKGLTDVHFVFDFDYTADEFPQELVINFTSTFEEKAPYITLTWITPDGREIDIGDFSIKRAETRRISQDEKLIKKLGGQDPEIGLFADPTSEEPRPLKGHYQLDVAGITFEPDSDFDAKLVIYGKVYGLAGTDHLRRDLMLALLWGTPVALAFGLIAALSTSVLTMIIAAVGTWYAGWMDSIIQRITEVNMMLPVLPILIMVGVFYSRSLWVILGAIIVLNIFGASIKSYRSIFLQEREASYIEAAKAYGASGRRIIFFYLIPRIIPVLIPSLVVLIPSFVFLEASLAVLGLGDPLMPTWGKIIDEARTNGALYKGLYYWVLEPSFMLMLTGFSFAMLGFALDRIFNPRLRGM